MKKLTSLIIALMLSIGGTFYTNSFASDTSVPIGAKQAAIDFLPTMKDIFKENPGTWGFVSKDSIDKLKIDKSYKLYSIDSELLKNAKDSIIDIKKDMNIWELTTVSIKKPSVFIDVENKNGKYKIIKYGGGTNTFYSALKVFNKLCGNNKQEPVVIKVRMTYYLAGKNNDGEFVVPIFQRFASPSTNPIIVKGTANNSINPITPQEAIECFRTLHY